MTPPRPDPPRQAKLYVPHPFMPQGTPGSSIPLQQNLRPNRTRPNLSLTSHRTQVPNLPPLNGDPLRFNPHCAENLLLHSSAQRQPSPSHPHSRTVVSIFSPDTRVNHNRRPRSQTGRTPLPHFTSRCDSTMPMKASHSTTSRPQSNNYPNNNAAHTLLERHSTSTGHSRSNHTPCRIPQLPPILTHTLKPRRPCPHKMGINPSRYPPSCIRLSLPSALCPTSNHSPGPHRSHQNRKEGETLSTTRPLPAHNRNASNSVSVRLRRTAVYWSPPSNRPRPYTYPS